MFQCEFLTDSLVEMIPAVCIGAWISISMVISGGALNDDRKRENVKNKLSMRLMVYITLGKEKANEK